MAVSATAAAAVIAARAKLNTTFYCKFLTKTVSISDCLDDYVNANALNIRNSPCFKCSHGLKVRANFSGA
ncbi:MAG: hypothetical protein AMXMBFR64_44210 [Myxococcales bacterium]